MADISKLQRLLSGVQRGINLANNELLVNNIKIKAGSGNDANYATFSGSLSAVRTISIPDANVDLANIAALVSLSGVAANATDLGTFTGTTIPDSQTIKQALQALETAVETAVGDTDFLDTEFRISDDGDDTKKLAFQLSSITTGNTRTVTMPDSDVNLGDIATNTGKADDLITLSGVAANSEDLGTFTGAIIPDNQTIKQALQALETEIESIPTPIFYAGTWDADTNSPDLDLVGARVQGALYRVTVAGTHDFGAFGGSIAFQIGDKAVYNGTAWEKWDVQDNENTDQITEGSTNLYFTDERAQDAVGNSLTDTNDIDFVYDDNANTISANLKKESITTKTAKTVLVNADEFLIADSEDSGALKKVTRANLLAGFETDIETVVTIANLGENLTSGVKALRWGVTANSETAGRLYLADNDTDNAEVYKDLFYVACLFVAAGTEEAGDQVMGVKKGKLVATGHGFTIGQSIFLDANGSLTSTAPSADDLAVVRAGIVKDANTIDVDVQVIGVN